MKCLICCFTIFAVTLPLFSQPQPGEVFREYRWYNVTGNAGCALRVGGRIGGTEDWGTELIDGSWRVRKTKLNYDFKLESAIKAEINIEKILCHEDTRGLAISVNGNDWIPFPEADNIPYPQWEYQHHIYPTVSLPLEHLVEGVGNQFQLKVDTTHTWNWPQNLIYGVHFRLYYEPDSVDYPVGKIVSPGTGDKLGEFVDFEVSARSPLQRIKEIDLIGLYEDVNFEGDGIYRQWHYHFYHGDLIHHIGTSKNAPYMVRWDTSWLPDQEQPMQVAARIVDDTDMIYMTEPITDLTLVREDFSVELCKPYDVPKKWLTRKGEHEEKFDLQGDLANVVGVQLVWSSWSSGYMNGVYINDNKVFDSEGPLYRYYDHRIELADGSALKSGTNILRTGKTPRHDGRMVHGMEVNWPGIMVLVRYQK